MCRISWLNCTEKSTIDVPPSWAGCGGFPAVARCLEMVLHRPAISHVFQTSSLCSSSTHCKTLLGKYYLAVRHEQYICLTACAPCGKVLSKMSGAPVFIYNILPTCHLCKLFFVPRCLDGTATYECSQLLRADDSGCRAGVPDSCRLAGPALKSINVRQADPAGEGVGFPAVEKKVFQKSLKFKVLGKQPFNRYVQISATLAGEVVS